MLKGSRNEVLTSWLKLWVQDNDGKIDYNEFVQMMRTNNPVGPGLDLGSVTLGI
jgi:hypothetical protein